MMTMKKHDIEQHFWHIEKQSSLALSEVGFIAFLIREMRESGTEDHVISRSDAYICKKLGISRKLLRTIRNRLVKLCVLVFDTAKGKGGGTVYQLSPMAPLGAVIMSPTEPINPIMVPTETIAPTQMVPAETITGNGETPFPLYPPPCLPLHPLLIHPPL